MFECHPGNQILDIFENVSSIYDLHIEENHEQDAEAIDDEYVQEILADFQEEITYIAVSGSNRNEENDESDDNKEVPSE